MSSRPQPVLTRAGLGAVISLLSALLVQTGSHNVSGWLTAHSGIISTVILVLGPLVGSWLATHHVAPMSDPRVAAIFKELEADLPAVVAAIEPTVGPQAPSGMSSNGIAAVLQATAQPEVGIQASDVPSSDVPQAGPVVESADGSADPVKQGPL